MDGHDLRAAAARGHARRKENAAAALLLEASLQLSPLSDRAPNREHGFLHAFNALLVEAVAQGVSRERIERCCSMRVRSDERAFDDAHINYCWDGLVERAGKHLDSDPES